MAACDVLGQAHEGLAVLGRDAYEAAMLEMFRQRLSRVRQMYWQRAGAVAIVLCGECYCQRGRGRGRPLAGQDGGAQKEWLARRCGREETARPKERLETKHKDAGRRLAVDTSGVKGRNASNQDSGAVCSLQLGAPPGRHQAHTSSVRHRCRSFATALLARPCLAV